MPLGKLPIVLWARGAQWRPHLVLIPFSFAGDFNDTAIGEEIVSEGIPGEDEAWIELDEDNYVVDEDDNTVIEGNVHIDIIDNPYPWELNVQCNYTDFDGVSRSYNSFYEYESFSFNTADFEGLKALLDIDHRLFLVDYFLIINLHFVSYNY